MLPLNVMVVVIPFTAALLSRLRLPKWALFLYGILSAIPFESLYADDNALRLRSHQLAQVGFGVALVLGAIGMGLVCYYIDAIIRFIRYAGRPDRTK